MTLRSPILSFLTAGIIAYGVTAPSIARGAFSRRQTAAECMPVVPWAANFGFGDGPATPGSVSNSAAVPSYALLGAVCPIQSDTSLPHTSITLVHVHGIDGDSGSAGYVDAQLCVDFWNWDGTSGLGGTCGSPRYSGNFPTDSDASATHVGPYVIEFTGSDLNVWTTNGGHFPYVYVVLPGRGTSTNANTGYSMLSGIYYEHTP